ncbi:unnamed protein product [Didymodactylos carnosus]|uniref:Uncharacterized protein n=1 Tax=Didymodactylos carnosus TaxID=1234261 RepID=A0A8S2FRE5_9BILA|nr:unnamed protein product [Didymodactylos carnosus]CAF4331634.1 unnamed protein product [Didymodactylos carnosus]
MTGSEESVMVRYEQGLRQQRSTCPRKARSIHNDAILIAAKQHYMCGHIDLEDLQKLLRALSHRYIEVFENSKDDDEYEPKQ